MASVLSEEPVGGHLGASVASEVLSGSQREVVEEDRHHSQVEAWEEEALSCLEGQEGLRERENKWSQSDKTAVKCYQEPGFTPETFLP